MNTIAIVIHIETNLQWPKLSTLRAIARYEVGRLKRKARNAVEQLAVNRIVDRVAMAFNPMPMALA